VVIEMIFHDANKSARFTIPWILARALKVVTILSFHFHPGITWFSTFADWNRGSA